MIKPRKLPKTYLEPPVEWLDKGWVDAYVEELQTEWKGNVKTPSFIAECLPPGVYQRLAYHWGLDPGKIPRPRGNTCKMQNLAQKEDETVEEFIRSVERDLGIRSDVSEDLQVNPVSSPRSGVHEKTKRDAKENLFRQFFKKTGELDVKKTKPNLGKKAGKITKMIIKKFLGWYQSLGGNDGETFIEESTLQELFQIGFDLQAAKAMAIRTKELPTVPECLAVLRNEPKHSTRYCLRKFLRDDIKLENIPTKMFAFGSMLPKERPSLRYKPPRNYVKKTWMECSRVPNDLNTMKTVWGGLEKLRSTIAFSNWLQNHPEITPPTYLEAKGLLKINYEEWNQMFKGFEFEPDQMDTFSADLKLPHEVIHESKYSESTLKIESYDSLL